MEPEIVAEEVAVKRGPGRPKGSLKKKVESDDSSNNEDYKADT